MTRIPPATSRHTSRPHPRPGFTLLELVLVLAVMATIAAIAWPQLQPGLSRASYRTAALQLKSEFAEAREQTIHDGQIREFRLKPGTGRYVIAVANRGADAEGSARTRNARAVHADRNGVPDANEKPGIEPSEEIRELPDEIVFRDVFRGNDRSPTSDRRRSVDDRPNRTPPVESSKTETLDDVMNSDSGEWVRGIRFFPDGRASEADVELEGTDAEHIIAVHVRGLTGGVKIGPVESLVTEGDRTSDRSASVNPATNTKQRP